MNIRRIVLAITLGLGLITLSLQFLNPNNNLTLAVAGNDNSEPATIIDGETLNQTNTGIISQVIAYNAGPYHSLVADSLGQLHVSFNNSTTDRLFYAVYSNTAWITQEVAFGNLTRRNSIAVDPNTDVPHISFDQDHDLKYAHWNGSAWISSTIVPGVSPVECLQNRTEHRQNAIAVDDDGNIHIVYSSDWLECGGYWKGSIGYYGPDCISDTLDAAGEENRPPVSIDLNSQGEPQLLYKKRLYGGWFRSTLQTCTDQTWLRKDLEYEHYESFGLDDWPGGAALMIDLNDESYWTYMWHGQVVSGTLMPKSYLSYGEDIGYSDIYAKDGWVYVVFQKGNSLHLAIKPPNEEWIETILLSDVEWDESDISLTVIQDEVHIIYYDELTRELNHLSVPINSILPMPDLSPSGKSVHPNNVQPGDTLSYTIRLMNVSSVAADNATLVDVFPVSTTYVVDSVWASSGILTVTNEQLNWSGQVISGNSVEIGYAVEISGCPDPTVTNRARLFDGFVSEFLLEANAACSINPGGYWVTINNGAQYTPIPEVTVTLSWDTGDNITACQICNDGGFMPLDECPWFPVDTAPPDSVSWVLDTYGNYILPKTIYARCRHDPDTIYGNFTDDIVYDPNAPTLGEARITQGLTGEPVSVTVKASDSNSGVDKAQCSNDAAFGSIGGEADFSGGVANLSCMLTTSERIYVRVFDRAGNSKDGIAYYYIFLPIVMNNSP